MIKQFLKLKTHEDIVCVVRSKNTEYFFRVKKPLYDNYFLTHKGIFKFDFMGYWARNAVFYTDVILPRQSTADGSRK